MILDTCSICIENIYLSKKEQDFFILPCKHIFHKNCILEWFGTTFIFQCPNCRILIPKDLIYLKKIKNNLFQTLKWYFKYQRLSHGTLEFLIEYYENKKLEKYFKHILFKQLIPDKDAFNIYVNACIAFKNRQALEIFLEYMPLQYTQKKHIEMIYIEEVSEV